MTYKMGVVGLGVMGASLARNIESKGFPVVGYDLDTKKMRAFLDGPAKGKAIAGADRPDALMEMLERPRRILMMVPAGPAVDSVIAHLRPHLEEGDILIDGGNSLFTDTDRRSDDLEPPGFRFVGAGVSGGEEGALLGPAIMPGGPREAWDALAPIFRAIAAKADDGEPCVDYMGPRGAGHYVKMVHNGIEYGDMQLIAEVYDILHRGAGLSARGARRHLRRVERGRAAVVPGRDHRARSSSAMDEETGKPLVDIDPGRGAAEGHRQVDEPECLRRRRADPDDQRRGRGAHPLVAEDRACGREPGAARPVAGRAPRRSCPLDRCRPPGALCEQDHLVRAGHGDAAHRLEGIRVRDRSGDRRQDLAGRLHHPREPARRHPPAPSSATRRCVNLLLDDAFRDAIAERQDGWRHVVQAAIGLGIPVPAMGSSLAYYDSYRSERLPANLTQAQRDFFGAHTYRRVDREGVVPHGLDRRRQPLTIQAAAIHTDGRRMDLLSTSPPKARWTSSRSARSSIGSIRASIPFRKATSCAIHVSGGEFNSAANLADCFGLQTGVATAMVDIRSAS